MWIQHLFSLIGAAVRLFFEVIGTTLLGRLIDVAFASAVVIATLVRANRERGRRAMWELWQGEYRSAVKFSLWCAFIIYMPIVVWSVGRAVYEDHEVLVQRSQDLRNKAKGDAVTLQQTKDECSKQLSDAKIQSAGLVGTNGQLQSQNRDQQNTINNCQNQAIKLITPAPFMISTKIASIPGGDAHMNGQPSVVAAVIANTNRTVAPIRLTLMCDQDFSMLDWTWTNPMQYEMREGAKRSNGNSFPVRIESAWNPGDQFLFLITYVQTNKSISCGLKQQ